MIASARPAARGLAAILAAALALPGVARAGAAARTVAVLEVREASKALPAVGARISALLARRTSLRVVGVDAARAAYGAAFDADLVACAGESACLAGIGRRLGVTEVLLVGVSEFGDVILTLQRIETQRGQVAGRIAEALGARAVPGDGALLGYLQRLLPESDFRRYGVLRVVADLPGAEVEVGGQRRGSTPLAPLRLPAPASYDIVVRKPGYLDFRASALVPPDAEVLVRTQLGREGAAAAWYERWWVVAIAGTVAVGAIATAVVVANGGDDDVPVSVRPF